ARARLRLHRPPVGQSACPPWLTRIAPTRTGHKPGSPIAGPSRLRSLGTRCRGTAGQARGRGGGGGAVAQGGSASAAPACSVVDLDDTEYIPKTTASKCPDQLL